INKRSLTKYITLVNFTKKLNLEDIYSTFDIFLLLSEYEGFGLPVLEAQAHNLPVFCSDIQVFREILGTTAYFIKDSLNQNSVLDIISCIQNKNVLEDYATMGLKNIETYSWSKMSRETLDLYNQ